MSRLPCLLPLAWAAALSAAPPHVLVLPFTPGSEMPAKTFDWAGESVSEAVRETLSNYGVITTSREEQREACARLMIRDHARLTRASALKLGLSLDVDYILFGTYGHENGEFKLAAQTIRVRHLSQGPEYSVRGKTEELSWLQSQLAWQSLHVFAPELVPPVDQFRAAHPVLKLAALENYSRGLLASSADQKYKFLLSAARADDRFGLARYELGRLQFERHNYRDAVSWLERIPSRDARHPQALFLAGLAYFQLDDAAAAETALQLVERALPLPEVLSNLGAAQARQGRFDEALLHFQRARDADPGEPSYHFNCGYALWRLGRNKEAAAELRAALARNPDDQEAAQFLSLAEGPAPEALTDPQLHARERLRTKLEESAYRQLRAVLERGGGK